eukprot:4899293-Alexandrium_andersonii.AAC.1
MPVAALALFEPFQAGRRARAQTAVFGCTCHQRGFLQRWCRRSRWSHFWGPEGGLRCGPLGALFRHGDRRAHGPPRGMCGGQW